jgi:SSS family solute:Na+ symporter
MNIALILIALSAVGALVLGMSARSGHKMKLEEWTVGGRGFGAVLVFLLLAGEIYTTFTFLGASGYAYGLGAPAYYILAYGTLAYVISYFMLPPVWAYARRLHLVTQPDFFAAKYDSPALGVLVALVGVVALVPYLVLQFTGLGIIVQVASYGAIPKSIAVVLGAAVVSLYVIVSGIRGSAWTAVVKDVLIILVAVFLGLYLPFHYQGGISAMFSAIDKAKPGFLAFAATGKSLSWFVSTVLLTALGFFMWPQSFAACYTARHADVFRRNAIVLPLYQLVLLFIFFVGFSAALVVPGLKGAASNMALLKVSVAAFPPVIVGIIGATGVLTALVPGSMIMMTAATLFSRNLVAAMRPGQTRAVPRSWHCCSWATAS